MNTGADSPASPYLPVGAVVTRVAKLTDKERLFALAPESPMDFAYQPGQFFMAGLPGYGEAPFSITSAPGGRELELCIRAVGNLTNAIHRVSKGGRLWIRGPFGRGFDTTELKGRDLVYIAGGIGIVPMRSLIKAVVGRGDYGGRTLIYGAKTPSEILFQGEMDEWSGKGMRVMVTIDKPAGAWGGNVGVVTTLMPKAEIRPGRTTAVIIGPPVMYKFVIMALRQRGLRDEDILVSLERRMKCGLGKCGHCQINGVYACQCGPVFKLSELKGLPEAL
ncbi:MAG: FAD/NAD(P)-binding protein [Deltaproteobacteria bacterium]|nr:FAD/NAD(P)-binding protein [Deltaproteobacteria bacterium]